ncbi:MAG: response regulator [Cyanobacteria bacterium P01_A01_bin.116]
MVTMSDKPDTPQGPLTDGPLTDGSLTDGPLTDQQIPNASTNSLPAVTIEKSLVSVSPEKAICPVEAEQKQKLTVTQAVTDKLKAHMRHHFTGITYVKADEKLSWKLYFYLGKLTWALTQTNQKRSWHRQLRTECPDLLQSLHPNAAAHGSIENFPHHKIAYGKLIKQVQNKQLDREPIATAIESQLCENLFDILQEGALRQQYGEPPLSFTDKEKPFLGSHFLIVRSQAAWEKAQAGWEAWQESELLNCLPNLKPVISQNQQLKEYIPEEVYECLTALIKGDQCLRDLAVDHGYELLPFTKRIHPFIQQGMIGLVQIRDLEKRKSPQKTPKESPKDPTLGKANTLRLTQSDNIRSTTSKTDTLNVSRQVSPRPKRSKKKVETPISRIFKPLVIYIEDSQLDSRTMGKIVQRADCQYFNIQEPIHAIPLLIEKKPQLIFLDLVMPIANGYEICAQIRRVSSLQKVPVIIVTSNNGIIDRIRTRLKGANGFMSKPIDATKVLKIINKYVVPMQTLQAS